MKTLQNKTLIAPEPNMSLNVIFDSGEKRFAL